MLDARLILVSGKGGVGKSAVAAGLSLVAQRQGKRVLAVEMGSPGGLSSHFSTTTLGFEPREVRPGLHAMHIVRSEALLEYLGLQLRLPGMGRFGAVARAFDALATAAPAVREIITIGKIYWEVRADRWDIVIADAPPTGQIGSYLRAPRSIAELVPTGRVRSQADSMANLLSDSELTSVVLVNLAEELPTTETSETMEWLAKEDVVPSPTVIVNRVLPEITTSRRPPGTAGEILDLHRSLLEEQERWLKELPGDYRLPYLFGLFTAGEVAAQLSDVLEAVL
jgi:anion-transporting  ArsA/GET3 family ATPase